jgi:hypothetical protein
MHRLNRLTLGQRIVAVIAAGLGLAFAANFIVSESWQNGFGIPNNAFLPSNGAQMGQTTLYAFGGGLSGWAAFFVWIAAIAIWAAASMFLLKRPVAAETLPSE